MTGKETDREKLYLQIEAAEDLTEQYRDALRRERAAKQQLHGRLYRRLAKYYRKLRRKKTAPPPASCVEGDLLLDKQTAAERRPLYIREERIAVYTVLFGAYDRIREPLLHPGNIDYYLITDQEQPAESAWRRLDASRIPGAFREDPILANRWCKMHPHLLFPDHEYSIYVDANIWVFSDLTPLAAGLDRYPAAMFRHKHRRCVYEEVQACLALKKDTRAALSAHRALLCEHGVPEQWGLLEASLIARKHFDPRCIVLMEAWWEAFLKNSRRDQISLIDVLWLSGIEPARIGTMGDNLQRCRLFLQMPHTDRDGKEPPKDPEELKAFIESV